MKRRRIAEVKILQRPGLHPGAIRVEVECGRSATGLTQVPGLMQALTLEQMVTAAVFEHESRCGRCSTTEAHGRGDRRARELTDRAWERLLGAALRRYAASWGNW